MRYVIKPAFVGLCLGVSYFFYFVWNLKFPKHTYGDVEKIVDEFFGLNPPL